MKTNKFYELDVRPILEKGIDPFNAIMEKLDKLPDNQVLVVINTFEPIPLLNILKTKGYKYETKRPEKGVVYTYIKKSNNIPTEENSSIESELSFEDVEVKFENNYKRIDVRELEMPMPMVTILETLESLNEGEALYVDHKRLPQYLLPELQKRDYKYVSKSIDDNNVKLIIFK